MSLSQRDRECAEVQLDRPLRGDPKVARRCHFALPVVLEVPPTLPNGEPFPTLYWLTCPLLRRRVARVEARGGVRAMDERAAQDEAFRVEVEAAHSRYREARSALGVAREEPRASGIGGSRGGTKCLHAHLAHHLVDGRNPIGGAIEEETLGEAAARISMNEPLPLRCEAPCVALPELGPARRNPAWSEPKA